MDSRLWNNRIRIRLSTSNTGLWFKHGKYTFVLKKLINPRIFKDQLLYKYEVPYNQYQNTSWFISPMAEIESFANNCINTWLYIADTNAPSLLVYSLRQNTSWRIQDRSFDPDPNYNVYSIGGLGIFTWLKKCVNYFYTGDNFTFADGIITVALSPKWDGHDRKLHYHAMSNIRESWVYVKHLKNPRNFLIPYGSPHLFYVICLQKKAKAAF